MRWAVIHLQRVAVNAREFGGDHRHSVSRVYFSLVVDGTSHSGLHANVRQALAGDASTPVEVGPPVGYAGALNQAAFSRVVERYYRNVIAKALQSGPAADQKVPDGVFISKMTAQFGLPAT